MSPGAQSGERRPVAGKGVRGETGKVSPRDFSAWERGGKFAASRLMVRLRQATFSCCDLFEFLADYFLGFDRRLQCGKDDAGGLLDDFQALGQQ